jgi:RNA polymerase sigma-70 factor, ECF subfamily
MWCERVITALYERAPRFATGPTNLRIQAFEEMYRSHLAGLFAFLVYRTGDRALAEDLAAETFARALGNRRRFDRRKASEKTWLYAIALNALRDHARRADAEVRALERAEPLRPAFVDTAVLDVERRDGLERAMVVLSNDEREAIALRFGAELTIPEIAAVTGEEQTTVGGRVYRALRKLREEMLPEAEAQTAATPD